MLLCVQDGLVNDGLTDVYNSCHMVSCYSAVKPGILAYFVALQLSANNQFVAAMKVI